MKRLYRGFKAECPSGVVREDTFKIIYSQFFSARGKLVAKERERKRKREGGGTVMGLWGMTTFNINTRGGDYNCTLAEVGVTIFRVLISLQNS